MRKPSGWKWRMQKGTSGKEKGFVEEKPHPFQTISRSIPQMQLIPSSNEAIHYAVTILRYYVPMWHEVTLSSKVLSQLPGKINYPELGDQPEGLGQLFPKPPLACLLSNRNYKLLNDTSRLKTGGVAQSVECLSSSPKVLGLIPTNGLVALHYDASI